MKPYSFLVAVFGFTLYMMYIIYKPFLLNLAIASFLVIATLPVHIRLKEKIGSNFAASFLTFFLGFLFLGPILYFMVHFSHFVTNLNSQNLDITLKYFKDLLLELPEFLPAYKAEIKGFIGSLDLAGISKNVLSLLGGAGIKSAVFLKDITLVIVFYFFINIYSTDLAKFFIEAIPYNSKAIKSSLLGVVTTMSIVTYSILCTAILEGLLFGFIVWFYGYDFILFCILYGFASLVPVFGGFLMWFPIALFEASNGHYQEAIVISLYSIFVVSILADTFVRPLIIEIINKNFNKTNTKVNSILIFFSITAGISTFGFWGAILGPGITALFVGIIKLFVLENKSKLPKY